MRSLKSLVELKIKEICLVIFFSFGKYLKDRHYAQNFISSCREHTGDGKAIKLERQVHLTVLRGSLSLFANWLLVNSCSFEAFLTNVSDNTRRFTMSGNRQGIGM